MERSLIIGASGGIGGAITVALRARGAEVTALSRSATGLNVTEPEAVDSALSALEGNFDRIVVATGILAPESGAPEKALSAINAQAMAEVLAVNTIGPALILRHAPRLLPKDRRAVLAVLTARVGSIGDNKLGGWHSYRASKAAANQLLRGAAIELSRSHRQAIAVALHPGTVATPFTANYPAHRKVPVGEAATNLLTVMDALTVDETGGFFDWAGEVVPW